MLPDLLGIYLSDFRCASPEDNTWKADSWEFEMIYHQKKRRDILRLNGEEVAGFIQQNLRHLTAKKHGYVGHGFHRNREIGTSNKYWELPLEYIGSATIMTVR